MNGIRWSVRKELYSRAPHHICAGGSLSHLTKEKLSAARRRFLNHAPRSLVQSWHDLMTERRSTATSPEIRDGLPFLSEEPLVAAWAAAFGRWMVYPSSCVQLLHHRYLVVCRSDPRIGLANSSRGASLPMWPFVVVCPDGASAPQETKSGADPEGQDTTARIERSGPRRRQGRAEAKRILPFQNAQSDVLHRRLFLPERDSPQHAEDRDFVTRATPELLSIVFPKAPLSDLCANYPAFRLNTPQQVRVFRLEGSDNLETCTTVWFERMSSLTPSCTASRRRRHRSAKALDSPLRKASLSPSLVAPNAPSPVRSVRLLPPTDVTRRFLRLPPDVSHSASWAGVVQDFPVTFRWTPQQPPPPPSLRVKADLTRASLHGVSVPSGGGIFLLSGLPSLLRLHLSNLVQAPCSALALWHQRCTLLAAARHASKQVALSNQQHSAAESPMLTTETVMGMALSAARRRSFVMQGFCFCSSSAISQGEGSGESFLKSDSVVTGKQRFKSFWTNDPPSPSLLAPAAGSTEKSCGFRGDRKRRRTVPRVLVARRRHEATRTLPRRRRRRTRSVHKKTSRRWRRRHAAVQRVRKRARRRRPRKPASRNRIERRTRQLALQRSRLTQTLTKLRAANRREHHRLLALEKRAQRARVEQLKAIQRVVHREAAVWRRLQVVSTLLRITPFLRQGVKRR